MKKNLDKTIYSYLIEVLTSINLHNVHKCLGSGEEDKFLEKLKEDTLNLIENFEDFDLLDPRTNIGLEVRVILRNEGKILLKKIGNELCLPRIPMPLEYDINSSVRKEIEKELSIEVKEFNLVGMYNLVELLPYAEKEKAKKPAYLVLFFGKIDKVEKKNYIFLKENDDINHVDKQLIEKGEHYVNSY